MIIPLTSDLIFAQGEPMNPFLQGLLDQLKNLEIDVPGLVTDPEFPEAALKLLALVLKHAKAK